MKPLGPPILAGAIAALGLAPAAAVAAGPPAERVGLWEVHATDPDQCVASRTNAAGTRIFFWARPDGTRKFIAYNPDWPIAGPYRVASLRGRERLELKGEPPNGLVLELGAGPAAGLAASDSVEVLRLDGSVVERVDLAGFAAAAARLPGCLERAVKHDWGITLAPPPSPPGPPPPLRPGLERPASAKFDLPALFSDADYPSAAIRAGEQGTVRFRLSVGTDGRVTGCTVTASSGSESLDSATCQLLAARAFFWPARDRLGEPAADSVVGRIVWRLPSEEPPPPPPS